jgi:hypothetical protein|tara:strand:- start:318 stop:1094 length:777 start_codon:yes stop_codon:yes gene_type:complete
MKTLIKDSLNFKSLSFIKELIPKKSIVSSFLLYSGALACGLAKDERYVTSHTGKHRIYEFWSCVLDDPRRVSDNVKYIYNMLTKVSPRELENLFIALQKDSGDSPDFYVRSAYFFLLNQISGSGSISSGKMDLKNFNPISLHTLQNFKINNFHLSYENDGEFLEILNKKDSDFLLLPVGEYSHNLFERGKNKGPETTTVYHKQLFQSLVDIDKKWVIVYKKHLEVFELYKHYNTFMVDKYGKRTIKKDKCEDIIIANF